MGIEFRPIWFDSLGAKSMATFVETPDVKVLIDPGAAEMQPGFPAPGNMKKLWKSRARKKIKEFLKIAGIVVISHYHHDHYLWEERDLPFYEGKTLFLKNPNTFINHSQRERSEEFFHGLKKLYGVREEVKSDKNFDLMYGIDTQRLVRLYGKAFYEKGVMWLKEVQEKWANYQKIPEFVGEKIKVLFAEGREIHIGQTVIRFTRPLFHGIEFSRTGWVFSTVIEHGGKKLLHTSDLCGPVIEVYTDWIISENPDYLIVDGPMTYTLGYMMSKTTLDRAVDNMVRIIKNTRVQLVIYDHHLLREKNFREHTRKVWETASSLGVNLVTASEFMGRKPVVEEFSGSTEP